MSSSFFFFNDTATTEIYPLSLHDALPISPRWTSLASSASPAWMRCRRRSCRPRSRRSSSSAPPPPGASVAPSAEARSEEHTPELQSHLNTLFRLLLQQKIPHINPPTHHRA